MVVIPYIISLTGNELYLKHNEVSYNDTTVAVAYEVPLDSLQKECTYELETSELTYEPSTEGNIYETPDALGGHVSIVEQ